MNNYNKQIETPGLHLTFDPKSGLPAGYALPGLKENFQGADAGLAHNQYLATVKHGKTLEESCIHPRFIRVETTAHGARVHYDVTIKEALAASFAIGYVLEDQSVQLSLEEVQEFGGYELLEVDLPSLLTISQQEGDCWIAHGDRGGHWTELAAAAESRLEYGERGEFPNFSVLPLVLLGKERAAAALEVQGYLSNTALRIYASGGVKTATVGASALYRVPGGADVPSLLVGQPLIARLDFVGDYDGNGRVDWMDAAKLVRDRMPARTTSYYDDKFTYIVQGQVGPSDETPTQNTFSQMEVLLKRIHALIDGNPQVLFASGWANGGHDTGYPNVTKVNPHLGGKAGWDQLKRTGLAYNANVTLNDNYDDMYDNAYTAGVFDESYVMIDKNGDLERHNAWNGVDVSYITGFAKYMKDGGPGLERASFTADYYDLKDGMLIDALSWWSIRNDWDPKHPASAVQNLAGKVKLLETFAAKGIYVGSELLRYPLIGNIAFAMDGPIGDGWNDFGGTPIPLMALVYRNSLIYGSAGGENNSYPDPKIVLFHNNRSGKWIAKETPDATIAGYYYMHYLPWMKLSALPIESFSRDGSTVTIGLGGNSVISIDYERDHQSVVYDGIEIMSGSSVTIPMDNGRIAFYSDTARSLSYPLPEGTDAAAITARKLTGEGAESYPFRLENGSVVIDVPAQAPVIVHVR